MKRHLSRVSYLSFTKNRPFLFGKAKEVSRKPSGFTIVELLIVIVIIGILAALVIVAYNGIQSRANDAAVKSDLNNFGKTMEIQKTLNGTYPTTLTANMGIKFSRGSYGLDLQSKNARYCINTITDQYIIIANTKSGNYFKFISNEGLSAETSSQNYGYYVCNKIGLTTTNPQQDGLTSSSWASWVN